MQDFLVISSLLLTAWLMCFYFWYLSWPETSAKVTGVNVGVFEGTGLMRPRKYRTVHYEYDYNGTKYLSRRQGLITAKAFGPNVVKNDIIKVRVCRQFQSLSCPSRKWFEAKVLIFSGSLLLASGALIYVLPPL